MPSPFPGMDPYIEAPQLWTDFHTDLAAEIRAALNRTLNPGYVARLAPYLTYEEVEIGALRAMRPDLTVEQAGPTGGTATATITPTFTPTTVESLVPMEVPLQLNRVEIHSTETEQLVTVIEILSPVNKRR